MRLSGRVCMMAIKNPPMKQTNPISHIIAAILLIQIFTKEKNNDKIRKMNRGGRNKIIPNKKRLKLPFFMPLPIREKPNPKYLNHVFIQRARCFTSWSGLVVFFVIYHCVFTKSDSVSAAHNFLLQHFIKSGAGNIPVLQTFAVQTCFESHA